MGIYDSVKEMEPELTNIFLRIFVRVKVLVSIGQAFQIIYSMQLQVVRDSKGNNTGVFIPMDKWMLIKSYYPNIEHVDDEIDSAQQMKQAALELYDDYKNDKELTIFTQLDFEDFYEAR